MILYEKFYIIYNLPKGSVNIITFLKKLGKLLSSYWNIWGAVLLSTFIAWLNDFSRGSMDVATSYLVLTLTCIGFFTFFKSYVLSRRKGGKATPLESAVNSQKSIKAINTAVDPLKNGEELGVKVIQTLTITKRIGGKIMKKIKNFFKALWGNKFTISNTVIVLFNVALTQVATYTKKLYNIKWFAEHETFVKVGSPILAGIIVFVDLYTTYTKYGFESLQELAERKASKLSADEKKTLKSKLKLLKDTLNKRRIEKKELLKVITDNENLMRLGYTLSMEDNSKYEEARRKIGFLDEYISKLEADITELSEKL